MNHLGRSSQAVPARTRDSCNGLIPQEFDDDESDKILEQAKPARAQHRKLRSQGVFILWEIEGLEI